ncbi:MAG: aspartate/methionine/tyrosine aminotransferase [Gammaproteobacteria bacterium]|jgi:aspartate/methionine/tyrosine aminotransferase
MPSNTFTASNRMLDIQSPVIPLVSDLIKKSPGTISLGQGVVYYPPPQSVYDKVTALESSIDFNWYSEVEGTPELRSCISNKLKQENNIHLNSSQSLIVTAGANMAFMNALMAITDPDDEVILLRPYYFNHEMAIRMVSCSPIAIETNTDFQPSLENIIAAITPKTKAVVTVSPNNPTGVVYSESTLRAINKLCQEYGLYHISDEAYEYFTYDGVQHFSVASIPESEQYTISLYSLSKAFGFASWRIGYMICPEHLLMSVKKAQDTYLICPTRIAQDAAIAAMQVGRAYTQSHLKQLDRVRNTLFTALQSINDLCSTPDSKGAFYFLVKLNTTLTGMQVVERLIREYKVAVIPGETFGMNEGCYCRIAYGALDKESSETGIKRLLTGLKGIIG